MKKIQFQPRTIKSVKEKIKAGVKSVGFGLGRKPVAQQLGKQIHKSAKVLERTPIKQKAQKGRGNTPTKHMRTHWMTPRKK